MHLRIGTSTRRANQLSSPPSNTSLDLNVTGVRARDGVTITAPVFILTKNVGDLEGYNYLYCVTWSRYYFIIDLEFEGELQYIYCTEDVLGTWNSVIRSQSFYCLRSSVGYDDTIADTQFPMVCGAVNKDKDTDNPWTTTVNTDGVGFYVTGIISENAGNTYGSVSYLCTRRLDELVAGLMETCYDEVSSNIQAKAYADPMNNIVSCIYIPTNLDISVGGTPGDLKIGLWDCPMASGNSGMLNGQDIIGGMVGTKIVELEAPTPPDGADRYYKHFPPYTTLSLYAPPFGDVDLPEECYRWCLPTSMGGYGGLRCTIYIDVRTGYGMLAVSPMGHTPQNYCAFVGGGQVGVDVNLSGVSQSGAWRYNADKFTGRMATFTSGVSTVAGAVSDISGAVGSFATMRMAKGVSDVANTVSDLQSGINTTVSTGINTALQNYENLVPSVSSVGGNGDFSGLMVEQPWSIRLVFLNNKIDNTNCGEPHMADCTPASVSGGFAIFQNVAVTGEMLLSEKNMINQFLTSGVYVS